MVPCCRFQVTFQRAVPKFVANLPITFPSSQIGRELRNKVRNYIEMSFQCLNYCKQMFIVRINNSMESSWSIRLPRRFVFHWIGHYYWVWTFDVYKRSSNLEMNLRTLMRSSRPISEIGNVFGKFATNFGTALWKVTWNRQ
jgi:hypothetical protein